MEHQSTGAVNGRLQAIHNRLDEGEEESHMTVSSAWEGKNSISQSLKHTTMGHLTDFELVLLGASVATFCFGFNTFVKEIWLASFKKDGRQAVHNNI